MRQTVCLLAAVVLALLAACGGGSTPAAQNPVDQARSTLTAGAAAVADGVATVAVQVTARDAGGAPLSGLVAVFQVNGANLSPSVATTAADGTATVMLTATVAGAKEVSVVIGVTALTTHATATFLAGLPAALAFAKSPASGIAGALGPVTLALTDAHGNACAATVVTISLLGGPVSTTLVGTVTATTNATGGASYTDLAVTRAGTGYTLHATTPSTWATSAAFNLQAGPAHVSGSTLSATPASIAADGVESSTLQATIGDQYGNPVAGAAVTFSSNFTATITQPGGVTGTDGKASGSVKSLVAGNSTISAVVNAATVAQAQLAVVALPPSAADSTVVAAPSSLPADGTSTTIVTVTVKDRLGRAVVSPTVTLAASPAATITPPSTTASAAGVANFMVKSTTVGLTTLTATAGGITITQKPSVTFVTPTYTIGGTFFGLHWDGLVLATSGQFDLTVPASATAFTFTTPVPAGTSYNVSIKTQPPGQRCVVYTGGTGTTGSANVTGIQITCQVTWKQVAAGDNHSLGLTTDGRLYAWGDNTYGQLGDGTTTQRTRPTYVGSSYASIAAGANHSLAIDTVGNLFAWGNNADGQLGDKSSTQRLIPTWITAGVKTVAAGAAHSLLVYDNGTLWAWGYNLRGQIGQSVSTVGSSTPMQVGNGSTWASVAAGYDFSVAITTGGVPYAFGDNSNGQLGVSAATFFSGAPLLVGGGFALTAATAGYRHVIGITTGGTLVGWGLNVDGEVGSGAPLTSFQAPVALTWNPAATPVTAVSAGSYYSMALKTATGEVASWGSNGGQFGDGTTAPRLAPSLTTANAKAIAAGKFHSLFINGDDYLEAAGYNAKGQLGNGGTTDYPYRGPLLEPLQ